MIELDLVRGRVLDRLRSRLDEVTESWLRSTPGPVHRREEERRAVRDLLGAVIDGAGDSPDRGSIDRLKAFLVRSRRQGVDLGVLVAELSAFRRAAWRALTPELRDGSVDPVLAGEVVNDAFDRAIEVLVRGRHEQQVVSLKEAASTDSLTGLSNHRHFYQRLADELKRAARLRYPVSILLIDLDGFKQFNDRYGHQAGDQALRQLGEVLITQRRSTDTCARYGGEEFAMILPGTAGSDATALAQNLAHRFRLGAGLSFSAGVATFPEHGDTPAVLVRAADQALYRAKAEGRDRIRQA